MTEERKQDLRQLLNEAMRSLEMRPYGGDGSLVRPVNEYKRQLQKRWTFYSERPLIGTIKFLPYIANEVAKSKLLDFIRVQFGPLIHEDKILSACFPVLGGAPGGYPLDQFLWQLLRIAIVKGVNGAVLAFDRCTEDIPGSFKVIALLDGIRLETTIQVFEGIQLVRLPNSASELPHYVPDLSDGVFGRSIDSFLGKTLLIIDYSVSPTFYNPSRPTTEYVDRLRKEIFRTEINSRDVSNSDAPNFCGQFCQVLSLACNSPVQISVIWEFIAESELYNLYNRRTAGMSGRWKDSNPWRPCVEAEEADIEEAKRLYKNLVKFGEKDSAKLRIVIERWMKSKTPEAPIDQLIDLAIAFEALYLSDTNDELTFKLGVRAAWYLGEDKADRQKLLKKFKDIYKRRSNAVHNGQLNKTVRFGEEDIHRSKFIKRAQCLCHRSIMKMLKKEYFPNSDYWDDLILGQ